MSKPSEQSRAWLERLVGFDTTSRDSNLELINAIADAARELGLDPQVFNDAPGEVEKANMVISIPDVNGSIEGGVLLAGHVDCVPVDGQDWSSDPFTLTERDGFLYGRGTADMKGFVACVLAAMPAFVEADLKRPIHLGFTRDEELGCSGAEAFVDAMKAAGVRPEFGFVGEPTSMRMIRGHKSINLVSVEVRGVAAHSSLTHEGVNAIEYASELVTYWRDLAERFRTEGPFDEAYPLAYTSASVNEIAGGNGVNIVPELCTVTMEFRAIKEVADAEVIAELKEFCAQLEQRMQSVNPACSVTVDVRASVVGLDTPADAEVVAFGESLGLEPLAEKVTYGTEAGIYTDGGIPCVVCGPGDIAVAHRPDECVSLDQLAACDAFLAKLLDAVRA